MEWNRSGGEFVDVRFLAVPARKKKKKVVRFEDNKTRYRRLIKRRRKQSLRSLASSVKLDTCQRVTFPKGYTFSYLNQKRDT